MQTAQLTVWKSPPQLRDVHDLDPGPMADVSQSTASRFVPVLQRAELVNSTRIGQWTCYRRNEARIAAPPELPGTSL